MSHTYEDTESLIIDGPKLLSVVQFGNEFPKWP